MIPYPIHVPRKRYRGAQPSLRQKTADYNEVAGQLERWVNDRVAANPAKIQMITYLEITSATGVASDRVAEILHAVEAGHHGLTVFKRAADD